MDIQIIAAEKPLMAQARPHKPAPFLPMSRAEMDALGWDTCDIVLVTGDAYVDHPSFGMALIGRAAGGAGLSRRHHRAARLAVRRAVQGAGQAEPVLRRHRRQHGFDDQPLHGGPQHPQRRRLYAGRRRRQAAGPRSDRLRQRCREAFKDVPDRARRHRGSLRRIAHYDYWSDKVRRSVLADAKCDLLLYGNAERAIVEIAHRLAAKSRCTRSPTCAAPPSSAQQRRRAGSRSTRPASTRRAASKTTSIRTDDSSRRSAGATSCEDRSRHPSAVSRCADPVARRTRRRRCKRSRATAPSSACRRYEQVKQRPGAYAHANRVLHLETQSGQRARAGAGAWRPRRLAQPAADPADHAPRWTMCSTCPMRARPHPSLRQRRARSRPGK